MQGFPFKPSNSEGLGLTIRAKGTDTVRAKLHQAPKQGALTWARAELPATPTSACLPASIPPQPEGDIKGELCGHSVAYRGQ